MTKEIKIDNITVIREKHGPDRVYVTVEGPCPIQDEDHQPYFTITVTAGYGIEWVQKMFGIEPTVVVHD